MDPEKEKLNNLQCHLLGEAFPDQFFVCVVFKRDFLGNLQPSFDLLCRPTSQNEAHLATMIASFIQNAGK